MRQLTAAVLAAAVELLLLTGGCFAGDGLLHLNERFVAQLAQGGLQLLDLGCLGRQSVLEPPPKPLLLLKPLQVEV